MSALTIFNRRQALTLLAGFAATRPLSLCGSISAQTTPLRDAVETLLRPLFTTNDPSLFRLAVDAYSFDPAQWPPIPRGRSLRGYGQEMRARWDDQIFR